MRQHQEWHISGMCPFVETGGPHRCNAGVSHGTRERAQAWMEQLAAENATRPHDGPLNGRAWTDFQMREYSYMVWDDGDERRAAEAAALAAVASITLPRGIAWSIQCPRPGETIYGLCGGGLMVAAGGPTQAAVDAALVHLIDTSVGSTGGSWWDERG